MGFGLDIAKIQIIYEKGGYLGTFFIETIKIKE